MTTFKNMISMSMKLAGVLAPGEPVSAADAEDCRWLLNAMLSGWSTNGLLVYCVKRAVFPLIPGTSAYTLGPSGTMNTARPARIASVGIISGDEETPIEVMQAMDWAAQDDKDSTSSIPVMVYPDGGAPQNILTFWPTPTLACSAALYTWEVLGNVEDLTTTVSFPAGYEEAVVYNLAPRVAALFGQAVSSEVKSVAMSSKRQIEGTNIQATELVCDVPGTGSTSMARLTNGYYGR